MKPETWSSVPDADECRHHAEEMLEQALHAGADAAEALVHQAARLEVSVTPDHQISSMDGVSRGMSLRVLVGRRAGVAYTSDFSPAGREALAEQAIGLAKLCRPDAFADLPPREDLAREIVELPLWDEAVATIDAAAALTRARRCERYVSDQASGTVRAERTTFARTMEATGLASSGGFAGAYRSTRASLLVQLLSREPQGPKRTVQEWTTARFLSDLQPDERLAVEAARRGRAWAGARPLPTCEVPVVFAPPAGQTLLRNLASAILGDAAWRRNSYLAERTGDRVASPLVNIVDDPLLPRAAGSRPFDAEGVFSRVNAVIEGGILRRFLCDTYAARHLGGRSTGSAGRSITSGIQATISNFILLPGRATPRDLQQVDKGLYVTELLGAGFDVVSGNYSQGASGFWIDRGDWAFPVSEVTVSGNFLDLWRSVDGVASDLDTRAAIQCPTFRISAMTVSGPRPRTDVAP